MHRKLAISSCHPIRRHDRAVEGWRGRGETFKPREHLAYRYQGNAVQACLCATTTAVCSGRKRNIQTFVRARRAASPTETVGPPPPFVSGTRHVPNGGRLVACSRGSRCAAVVLMREFAQRFCPLVNEPNAFASDCTIPIFRSEL
ncbi:unnamed protein product [Lota lota]